MLCPKCLKWSLITIISRAKMKYVTLEVMAILWRWNLHRCAKQDRQKNPQHLPRPHFTAAKSFLFLPLWYLRLCWGKIIFFWIISSSLGIPKTAKVFLLPLLSKTATGCRRRFFIFGSRDSIIWCQQVGGSAWLSWSCLVLTEAPDSQRTAWESHWIPSERSIPQFWSLHHWPWWCPRELPREHSRLLLGSSSGT